MKRLPISAKNYPGERSCAAATWTPLRVSGGATEEKLKQFGGKPSMGRPDQPAELVFILVQLAASDASYPTRTTYDSAGRAVNRRAGMVLSFKPPGGWQSRSASN